MNLGTTNHSNYFYSVEQQPSSGQLANQQPPELISWTYETLSLLVQWFGTHKAMDEKE